MLSKRQGMLLVEMLVLLTSCQKAFINGTSSSAIAETALQGGSVLAKVEDIIVQILDTLDF